MTRITLLTVALATQVNGAGFQLAERSARGFGRAFSGEAAIADDASVLASNPAGISLLDDWSFSIGASYINADADISGSTPDGNLSDNDVIPEAVVPYAYLTKKLNDQVSIGIGVYTTYGLKSDYSRDFANQAETDFSELLSFNVNPAISVRLSDHWTFGFGLNALYADGNLTSRSFEGPAAGLSLFDLKGDDWGFGYNLGLLFELSPQTRFGLHYRSAIDLSLNGEADLGPGFGPFTGTLDATLDVELPDTFEFSAYHEINSKLALHADILWTNWSKFESLDPSVGNPLIDPALSTRQDWDDAYRFSIGATYRHSERLTFRAGFAYDESPTSDSNRTLRIPDSDRFWASLGASLVLNETYTLDIGYTHIFADDVDLASDDNGGNAGNFNGQGDGNVNLLALGLSGSF